MDPRQIHNSDFRYTEPHYSTSIFKGYLTYLEIKFGREKAKNLISSLPLTWDYLNSHDNWVSEDFSELLYDTLAFNPEIPENFSYEAGLLSMSKENLGPVQYMITKLLSMEALLKASVAIAKKFAKLDKLEILQNHSGIFSLRFESNRSTKHIQLIADNWRGNLESIFALHNHKNSVCEVNILDAKTAIFRLKWQQNKKAEAFPLLMQSLLFMLSTGLLTVAFYYSVNGAIAIWCLLGLGYWRWQKFKRKDLQKEYSIINNLLAENEARFKDLYQHKMVLDRRYDEARLISSVINRITQSKTSDELISLTIQEVKKTLSFDRVIYFAQDQERGVLAIKAAEGFPTDANSFLRSYEIDLNEETESPFHIGNIFKRRTNILVPVTQDYMATLSKKGKQVLEVSGSKSFIACTVASERHAFGLLVVDYQSSQKQLNSGDLQVIQDLSNQLAILLENAFTLENEVTLRRTFQRYVPPIVVEALERSKNSNQIAARILNVTVIFSDIRSFTSYSSQIDPSDLVAALNHYLSEMTEIIYSYGGIVDKFLGDGIMAVFNAFDNDENHCFNGCMAALKMNERLESLNHEISLNILDNAPKIPIVVGFGIHTGPAVIGNIGSKSKMEFTSLGKTVNLASRLQEFSKKYPGILISEDVAAVVGDNFKLSSLGIHRIRGLDQDVEILKIEGTRTNPNGLKKTA